MKYTCIRYTPLLPINTYIYYLYYLDGMMPLSQEEILPLPALDLKINYGGAVRVSTSAHLNQVATFSESWCEGLWSVPRRVGWPTNLRLYGISFKPDGAYPFLQLPLSELSNQVISLEMLWGQLAVEIRDQLYAAPTVQAGFDLLEQWLLARLHQDPYGLDIVRYANTQIARHHGVISIRALSDHIGVSQNHLNTQFKRMIGIPPKEYARFCHFEHVLRSIDPGNAVDWTVIAHQSRYYDQSHLYKDFVAFTGHNPTDYLRLRSQIYNTDLEHNWFLRSLPID